MENKSKFSQIQKLLIEAQELIKKAHILTTADDQLSPDTQNSGAKIIEGYFDGENMKGDDGKKYPVPANYASKSKIVQGDRMKLTIGADGNFIYKQIGPVEREKKIGKLIKTGDQFAVKVKDEIYKVLLASITYFEGKVNDEVTIILPKGKKSNWAVVEAIISKS